MHSMKPYPCYLLSGSKNQINHSFTFYQKKKKDEYDCAVCTRVCPETQLKNYNFFSHPCHICKHQICRLHCNAVS